MRDPNPNEVQLWKYDAGAVTVDATEVLTYFSHLTDDQLWILHHAKTCYSNTATMLGLKAAHRIIVRLIGRDYPDEGLQMLIDEEADRRGINLYAN